MTGFGRGVFESEELSVLVDVKSLNGRFLNVRLHCAQEISGELDLKIRQRISEQFLRGNIEVNLSYQGISRLEFDINRSLIEGFLQAVNQIKEEFNLLGEIDLNSVAFLPKAIIPKPKSDSSHLEEAIFQALEDALNQLEKMRVIEGRLLKKSIMAHLKKIEKTTALIGKTIKESTQKRFQTLRERIEELLSKIGIELDEARFAQEIAYLAERSNINEELERLKSHVQHARSIISEGVDVGKRLDFLLQELNREANTILSKTWDIRIKQLALEMKGEIEKIKEQVQNIE
jgi:uncharacterized protein (TIGR00255 family)